MKSYIDGLLLNLKRANPGQEVFIQASTEILYSLIPLLKRDERYVKNKILERILAPGRTMMFRVVYMSDGGEPCVHTGYRIEFNSALGPY